MSPRPRGYAHRVDIRADAATVWARLTSSDDLRRWCSRDATITAREGGLLHFVFEPQIAVDAHIDVFQPPRRLRLIHLPQADLPAADSAIVEDVMLDDSSGVVTVVRLLGAGVPGGEEWDELYRRLRAGWERALPRLKLLVEKGPPRSAVPE